MTIPQLDEEFFGEAYTEAVLRHPYAQIVNKKDGFGLFLPHEERKKLTFRANTSMEEYTLTLAEGGKVDGYRFKAPRMAIIRETPLFMVHLSTKEIFEGFDKALYETKNYKLVKKYLFFLLDEVNRPYHDEPLSLSVRGAAGASFNAELGKFRKAINNLFAEIYKEKFQKKQGNKKFNALMVFEPLFQAVMKGEGNSKNWVCSTQRYSEPERSNIVNLFAGYNQDTRKLLEDWFEEAAEFEILSKKPAAQQSTEDLSDVLNPDEIPY